MSIYFLITAENALSAAIDEYFLFCIDALPFGHRPALNTEGYKFGILCRQYTKNPFLYCSTKKNLKFCIQVLFFYSSERAINHSLLIPEEPRISSHTFF